MKPTSVLLFVLLMGITGAAAQEGSSRAEIFAGYSYANVDFNALVARQSLNGWDTSAALNVYKWFGAEWDGSGYYKTVSLSRLFGLTFPVSVSLSDYSFLAGPRLTWQPVFVHALFGFNHLIGSASGQSASQDSLAGALGGGVEWPRYTRLAVRGSADYVFTRHNIVSPFSPVTQNNVRAAAGIVIRFGRGAPINAAPATTRTPMQPERPTVNPRATEIPGLGIQAIADRAGVEILQVNPGSPAQAAGLQHGDVIDEVDGQAMKSPADIAAYLSSRSPGSHVEVSYRIAGNWRSHATVFLPAR